MTIRHFPTNEWIQQSHRARLALGKILKLIEDGVLVQHNFNKLAYVASVLKEAQETLKSRHTHIWKQYYDGGTQCIECGFVELAAIEEAK